MTLNEYLENHDEREGAEEETTVTRCPSCGNDECEVYAIRDGEIVGCDNCLVRVNTDDLDLGKFKVACAHCGANDIDEIYFRHKDGAVTEIVGCDNCIREVERWRWEAKA